MNDRDFAFLNALATVMSDTKSILYTWYIEKYIFSNCLKNFERVSRRTRNSKLTGNIEYQRLRKVNLSLIEMYKTYISEKEASCISYLERTWDVHKEKEVVQAYTDDHMRFNICTSSWM